MVPLSGGGNNRGFRVETPEKPYFLKIYAHDPKDKRDRLKAEFGFCRFAWDQGLRSVPQPLAKDEKGHLGLYEYIDGRLLTEKDVTAARVKEAVRFFIEINRRRFTPAAKRLPPASEACFSISEHLWTVNGRVERLRRIKNKGPRHRLAIRFVANELVPAWRRLAHQVRKDVFARGLSLRTQVPRRWRCLSPSDFGFHNAILTKGGRLRFIDFEYAGWDDVAKTVCDFALQPRLPFPRKLVPLFSEPVLKMFGNPAEQRARIRILYPVFALKWCCIILNRFLRDGKQPGLAARLRKAKKYLRFAEEGYGVR